MVRKGVIRTKIFRKESERKDPGIGEDRREEGRRGVRRSRLMKEEKREVDSEPECESMIG